MELKLVHKIYKDSDMSVSTLNTLIEELDGKNNEMIDTVKHIKKGYERYKKKASNILNQEKVGLDKIGVVTKIMAEQGVTRKVKYKHNDSSIASMLIKGIHMGVVDIDHELEQLDEKADKKSIELARDFIIFQKDNIKALKLYL